MDMELIYIEPLGVWKGLSMKLTLDPDLGKIMLDPHTYGGKKKYLPDMPGVSYYVMQEDKFKKAQRDCFKFFYRNSSRKLSINNEIIRDRTIVCNLMSMKYDMTIPETGSMVLRDASPYMAKLMYDDTLKIDPDEYQESVIEYARNFNKQINKLRNYGSLFILDSQVESITSILMEVYPFSLPKLDAIRRFDKYISTKLIMRDWQYEEICDKVREYSLLPACLASDTGFNEYVQKIVAEAIFEYKYPTRIESGWARDVNKYIRGAWLTNPHLKGAVPIPCRIVDSSVDRLGNNKIKVLASDADAELELPYNRDDIYVVDPSWLVILTKNTEDMNHLIEAGFSSCEWV